MTLKDFLIIQNVKVPEKLDDSACYFIGKEQYYDGYNECLSELLSIELPEQRKGLSVEEMMEISNKFTSLNLSTGQCYIDQDVIEPFIKAIHEALGGEK